MRAPVVTEGDSVGQKLKIMPTPENLNTGAIFVARAVPRWAEHCISVLVGMQLSQCNVGDISQARKIAETGLTGISGDGWGPSFHIVCAM